MSRGIMFSLFPDQSSLRLGSGLPESRVVTTAGNPRRGAKSFSVDRVERRRHSRKLGECTKLHNSRTSLVSLSLEPKDKGSLSYRV